MVESPPSLTKASREVLLVMGNSLQQTIDKEERRRTQQDKNLALEAT